ncbi:hypothetical protein [Nitrospirillum amazonense]|uniref:Uncharacterized protein n=1 Tax=Nitrospirillum amazonense TaxID=28077 RepID=A0A560JVI1_9PROT|nr:hypothetical protein [Nitrospirillum amazonense]MDG3440534.1 hypothetical protein [Nitrospirillum amazonense]TWB75132.1 hypothetical protein FBZ87_104231 [Nitrospirillum amazonense]
MTDRTLSPSDITPVSPPGPHSADDQPTDAPVRNAYAYAMAALPPIAALIEYALLQIHSAPRHDAEMVGSVIAGIAYLVMAGLDRGAIRPALNRLGRDFSFFWVLFIPAYLWQRTTCLNQSRRIFWIWWLGFGISVVLDALLNNS